MLDNVKYVNHLGEIITFGKESGIFINYNDLRDFSWSYDIKFSRIKNLRRTAITNKTIPLVVYCKSEEEGILKKNELYEIMEKDVIANQYGKFVIGDYYLECFITESKKENYLINKGYLEVTLKAATDKGYWVKEKKYMLYGDPMSSANEYEFYNHDYPYDYGYVANNKIITNDRFKECDFVLKINGEAVDPKIMIGLNKYELHYTINSGDYVIIDSKEKTITLVKSNGEKINIFNYRATDSYIFEPIASGNNEVVWDGNFDIAIILLEERGEPEWT